MFSQMLSSTYEKKKQKHKCKTGDNVGVGTRADMDKRRGVNII
jgi:hypothetical protein